MKRTLACLGSVVLLSWLTLGQSTEKLPAFESADVHVSLPATFNLMIGGVLRNGRFEVRNATMLDLVKTAYEVDDDAVYGGPSWLETDRFDIVATASPETTPAAAKLMLQTLLAERFKLAVHKDTKQLTSYVLSVGSGAHKLKEAAGGAQTGCQGRPPDPPPAPGTPPSFVILSCHNMTTAAFAGLLHQVLADHPVVDSTKLDGAWDFDIKVTPPQIMASAGAEGISVFDAVDKQLGLKLELKTTAAAVMVVDNVVKTPSGGNSAASASSTPAPLPEFEAVDLKLSAPGDERNFIRYSPGGRWDASGPLRNTIGFAYDIPGNLRADLMVVPKWVETYHFDVVAKAPNTGLPMGGGRGGPGETPTDDITLRQMVHAMLIDRFKLAAHFEDRQTTIYALLAPKGETKLKKADPDERSSCKPDPNAAPSKPGSGPMIAIRCKNTTLADLAHNIGLWAGGYIDHPVVNTTGLQGGYDFVLAWTPRGALDNQPRPTEGAAGLSAADPGGLSIFEAVQQELGLKMEVQKQTVPVLVVDHVEPMHE